jgi:hypothetical protein
MMIVDVLLMEISWLVMSVVMDEGGKKRRVGGRYL